MDRAAFLERIRSALAGVDGPPLPDAFPVTPASGDGTATPERFLAALEAVGGSGRRVSRSELPAAVGAVAAASAAGGGRAVVTADVEPFAAEIGAGLREAGVNVLRPADGPAWRDAAAAADLGVTGARLGVAATGSVLIVSGARSPRAASILPAAHLVVLPADRLVPGLEDVMPVLASATGTSSAPFLVTGPSRTSDIEMTMVVGVHGPRALHVLLVSG